MRIPDTMRSMETQNPLARIALASILLAMAMFIGALGGVVVVVISGILSAWFPIIGAALGVAFVFAETLE
jgi:hypothetical protein